MKKFIAVALLGFLATSIIVWLAHAETAIAPEVSPPGDIPDSQSFVGFSSPAGFSIKVPEGWARKDDGLKTTFSDKYNHILLQQSQVLQPIDGAYAKATLVPDLQKNGRAIDKVKIKSVRLKSGTVIVLDYDSNSEPNAVTNKQVREENESLYFVKGKQLVTMTLSAPKGADNVDQWLFMANSFRWK